MRRTPRAAFTMVEVLVTIAVIGVLAALLLPAVAAARRASLNLHCQSRLRDIGVAIHSYESVHGMFPPGALMTFPGGSGYPYSAHAHMLPHLGRNDVFECINFAMAEYENVARPVMEHRTARDWRVAAFVCPAAPNNQAKVHLRANTGIWPRFPGPFRWVYDTRPASVMAGLSNVAFFSERRGGSFWATNDRTDDMRERFLSGVDSLDGLRDHCWADDTPAGWITHLGQFWLYNGIYDTEYNHAAPPNDRRPACLTAPCGACVPCGPGIVGASSAHGDAVNVLWGDGHMTAVGGSIDETLWARQGFLEGGL